MAAPRSAPVAAVLIPLAPGPFIFIPYNVYTHNVLDRAHILRIVAAK